MSQLCAAAVESLKDLSVTNNETTTQTSWSGHGHLLAPVTGEDTGLVHLQAQLDSGAQTMLSEFFFSLCGFVSLWVFISFQDRSSRKEIYGAYEPETQI